MSTLTKNQLKNFEGVATTILVAKEGENWQKAFRLYKIHKERKHFSMPVLANIVLFDLQTIQKNKLANMVMKKIHDHDPSHVYKLLKTFMSPEQIKQKWLSLDKGKVQAAKRERFESFLAAA